MLNTRKIFQAILIVAFMCVFIGHQSRAQLINQYENDNAASNVSGSVLSYGAYKAATTYTSENCDNKCPKGSTCTYVFGSKGEYSCIKNPESDATEAAGEAVAGTNSSPSEAAITGCSSNYGLFSGLINTGKKVFSGLRDLIYVVAGFGIIGVAVGGFFGNLNWKWLGAIVISLVVIATTGELINLITGCKDFTSSAITDTLIK